MQVAIESRRHREKTRQDDQDSQDEKPLLSAAASGMGWLNSLTLKKP
jgi:hypothetical protein